MSYALVFIAALMISILLTPAIRYLGIKFYVFDKREERKIHKKVVTKLGGIAIYFGFVFSLCLLFFIEPALVQVYLFPTGILVLVCTLIMFLGIYDDVMGAEPLVKLAAQILAGILVVKGGLLLPFINDDTTHFLMSIVKLIGTTFFIVFITNAFNLIDGVDGLAAGIATIVIVCLFFIGGIVYHDKVIGFTAIALAGATLGFLRYNFYPAKIFMGDTGSLFLGFSIAVLLLRCNSYVNSLPVSMFLVLPIIVPLSDTGFAIYRRTKKKKNVFKADGAHIHHLMLKKGLSQVRVVLILYGITLCASVLACCGIGGLK